jgi:predicted glycosyltransferase
VSTGVLFHARNRRGLGHFIRAQNIATELQRQNQNCPIRIHATQVPAVDLVEPSMLVTSESEGSWEDVVESFRPEVIVHDTTITAGPARLDYCPKRVLVLRRRGLDQHEALLNEPQLRTVSKFIIPHTCEEFGLELPHWVRTRAHFVGPIGRIPDSVKAAAVRTRLGVAPDGLLITATVGGGGFESQADRFFEIVAACAAALASIRSRITFLIVLGPNYARPEVASSLALLPNTRVVVVEPRVVDAIAASDFVIAEGGYNTVTEVILAQTPAIFIPSRRKLDDQRERVDRVAATGAALVVDPAGELSSIASFICARLSDESALDRMRTSARAHRIELGNAEAASVILSLLGPKSSSR